MPGYRINERNTGHWTIDGEPKRRRQKKQPPKPIPTDEQMTALSAVDEIENLLGSYESDYLSYVRFNCTKELHKKWLGNGVVTLATRIPKYKFIKPDTILALNPNMIDDLTLTKNILIEVYELQSFV